MTIPAQYTNISTYSFIQTFYADPEIVNNSGEIAVTSVNLYFKAKPDPTKSVTGKPSPQVMIAICNVRNEEPVLTEVYRGSINTREFSEINAFSDASAATTFGFPTPVRLKTGQFYGIVVVFDDPGYVLWTNKQGDKLVGTNTPSAGSNLVKDGKLFAYNNSGVFKALSDSDLKFGINVAKYVSNTATITFVNDGYEFFDVNTRTGEFLGGEWVYGEVANATGNVVITAGNNIITGVGTSFDTLPDGTRIVVYGNTTSRELVTITNVVNSSFMYVDTPLPFSNNQTKFKVPPAGILHYKDNLQGKLFLSNSNANTTLKFANNMLVVGVDSLATANIANLGAFTIDRAQFKGGVALPTSGGIDTTFYTAIWNGSSYTFNNANSLKIRINNNNISDITRFDAFMLSRSLEVDNSNLYSNTDLLVANKSNRLDAIINVNESNTGLYQSPIFDRAKVDMLVIQNRINSNTFANDANNVPIDTEVAGNGTANSRHISIKVNFENNRFAEDIRMFMTAWRPANTNLRIYARVHNSADPEAFDDKAWTPLEYKSNINRFSSNEDQDDLVEYELGLPSYSETANVLPGVFASAVGNTVLVATGVTPTDYVANNDVVKLYNPLIPEDYMIGVVASANSTAIVLGSAVSNTNFNGTGFKVDRVKYYNIAFNNIDNDNVSRYYNSSLVEFDKFDSMQIKIVMLSDSTYIVPKIDQIQVIGVSA